MCVSRFSAAIVAVSVTLVFGGCGDSGDEAAIRKVVSNYWEATSRGDGVEACAAATGAFQREILGGPGKTGISTGQEPSCAERVQRAYQQLGADNFATLADITISKVDLRGDSASVTLQQSDKSTCKQQVMKVNDEWKVAGQCK